MARNRNKNKRQEAAVVEERPANVVRNEKGCAKRHARKAALLKVLDYVSKQADHGLAEEIALLTPGQRFGAEKGMSRLDSFAEFFAFADNAEVKGLEIYRDFGAGQGEMRTIVRNLVKARRPAERIWVHYDKPSDTYTVMGVGAEPPKGWTGYRPVEVEDVEIV